VYSVTKNEHDSIELTAAKLQMSPTLERLYQLAKGCSCDVLNPDNLKAVLSTCSIDLINALDNNRIQFKWLVKS
jgi:hypothetical protein